MNALKAALERSRPTTFAAVIFHADEAAMLRECIEHHLAIGVDRVFVSLNWVDPESVAVADAFASERVRVARLEEFAPDPFDFFDAGLRAVAAWAQPDWVMCIDSDEFWVPAGGSMRMVAGLDDSDACTVRRFNAPPIRDADGTIRPFNHSGAATALVVGARHTMDAEYLARNPATPWINARIGPKLMVRPQAVGRLAYGAHTFAPANDDVRSTVPDDLMIVHLPFTTEMRFRRKVDGIRAMLAQHHHRLTPGEAWHWRRWLTVADAGGLSAEFAAQVIDADEVPDLRSRGILATPRELFATRRLIDA